MRGFSFALSSTAAAAVTGFLTLVYSQDLGGASIYQIEGNEDLRIKRVEPYATADLNAALAVNGIRQT